MVECLFLSFDHGKFGSRKHSISIGQNADENLSPWEKLERAGDKAEKLVSESSEKKEEGVRQAEGGEADSVAFQGLWIGSHCRKIEER